MNICWRHALVLVLLIALYLESMSLCLLHFVEEGTLSMDIVFIFWLLCCMIYKLSPVLYSADCLTWSRLRCCVSMVVCVLCEYGCMCAVLSVCCCVL